MLEYYSDAKGFETNYKILPRLASLTGGDIMGHEDGSFMAGMVEYETSTAKAILRMAWYLVDNWIGSIFWKNRMRIFGRYYYDYGYLRSYRMISLDLRIFFMKLAAKPDLLVVLKRKPEEIYRYKKELSVNEIEDQYSDIQTMLKRLNGQRVLVLEDMSESGAFETIIHEVQKNSGRFNQ